MLLKHIIPDSVVSSSVSCPPQAAAGAAGIPKSELHALAPTGPTLHSCSAPPSRSRALCFYSSLAWHFLVHRSLIIQQHIGHVYYKRQEHIVEHIVTICMQTGTTTKKQNVMYNEHSRGIATTITLFHVSSSVMNM